MRISKDKARNIASFETSKKYNTKIQELKDKLGTLASEFHHKNFEELNIKIPKHLIEANYIKMLTTSYVYYGPDHGDYISVDIVALPVEVSSYKYNMKISIDERTSPMKKLSEKILSLEEEKKEFQASINNTILSFGTDKRLIDNIPEMAIHFEQEVKKTNQIVPLHLIKDLRSSLVRP